MTHPQRPQFSFTANSALPDDHTGAGRWVVPVLYRGNWDTETVTIEFQSWIDANAVNGMLDAAWKAGEAAGHAKCKAAVLAALESK